MKVGGVAAFSIWGINGISNGFRIPRFHAAALVVLRGVMAVRGVADCRVDRWQRACPACIHSGGLAAAGVRDFAHCAALRSAMVRRRRHRMLRGMHGGALRRA